MTATALTGTGGAAVTGAVAAKAGAVVTGVTGAVAANAGAAVTGVVAAKTGAVIAAPAVVTGTAKLMKIFYVEAGANGPSILFVQYSPTGPICERVGKTLVETSLTISDLLSSSF